jgi:hypothetical protein
MKISTLKATTLRCFMSRAKLRRRVITVVLCRVGFLWAEQSPPSQPPAPVLAAEETALHTVAERFFATYAKRDLEGFMSLWSRTSPERASRQRQLEQLIAAQDSIEVKSIAVHKVRVEGERASLRVGLEMSEAEAKTGKAAARLSKRMRSLECIKEDGGWKVWREGDAVEELAAGLAALKTERERRALLEQEPELVTVELGQALVRQGNSLRLKGSFSQALGVYQLAHGVAEQLGDQAVTASALGSIGIVGSAV